MPTWFFLISCLSLGITAYADETLPPEFLFHVGKKAVLTEDAEAGTIPAEAWEKYVMGKDTRYGLTPYRRGLYGSDSFDELELYGNLLIGKADPWVMKIQIKSACRTPSAVTSIYQDPRYGEWLAGHVKELFGAAENCLNPRAHGCSDLITGQNPVANGEPENACDGLLEQFLNDIGAKVVRDPEWAGSWYIRDRDCIESLKASPDDVLKILAEDAAWDQKSRQREYSGGGGYGVSTFGMMVSALAQSAGPSSQTLQQLRKKVSESSITFSSFGPEAENPHWVKVEGPKVLDAFERCQRTGNLSAFRKEADAFTKGQGTPNPEHPDGFNDLRALIPIQQLTGRLSKICGS